MLYKWVSGKQWGKVDAFYKKRISSQFNLVIYGSVYVEERNLGQNLWEQQKNNRIMP